MQLDNCNAYLPQDESTIKLKVENIRASDLNGFGFHGRREDQKQPNAVDDTTPPSA